MIRRYAILSLLISFSITLLLVLFLHIFIGNVQAEPNLVEVGGTLTEDTVWTAVNSPYVLTSTIQIPAGITLTIEPGVTVFGKSSAGILVEGNIVAIGTPTVPITFTSFTNSEPGEWPGLLFWDGAGHLDNVTISFGGELVSAPFEGLPTSGANISIAGLSGSDGVTIRNSTIYGSDGYGAFIPADYLHLLRLENVTFTENITNRVQLLTSSGTPITTNVTLLPQPGLEGYEIYNYGLIIAVGTLTLDAGTTLFIPYQSGIIVQGGNLVANGTPENPVTITSVSDTAIDRWGGILVWFGTTHFYHSRVRFGGEDIGQNSASALHLYEITSGEAVIVENSTFYGSSSHPILVEIDDLHRLKMANNSFVDNAQNHIQLLSDPDTDEITLVGEVYLPGQDGLESYELAAPGLIVPDGVTLTVGAGATMMISDSVGIQVAGGHLDVLGTENSPVTFTSIADSGSGEWTGVLLEDGTAEFHYAELRYAENNLVVNNTTVSSTILLRNSQLHSASNNGLLVQGGAVTAVCATFNNNGNASVYVADAGTPNLIIANSNIYSNNNFGLFNAHTIQVDARNNWWGHPTGPAGIGLGVGDAVQGNVLFSPWQMEATCQMPYLLYLPSVLTP